MIMREKFIVCGASRSGKSILAKRISSEFNVSWLLGDAIVSSLQDAFPEYGISHQGDLAAIGDRLEAYIKFLLWNYGYAGCGYVFDSTHLGPHNVANIKAKIGEVPVVFLGYAEAEPHEKMHHIRRHDPTDDWWTRGLADDDLLKLVTTQIDKSRRLKRGCEEFGLPYVDVSQNFHAAVDEAEEVLRRGARAGEPRP